MIGTVAAGNASDFLFEILLNPLSGDVRPWPGVRESGREIGRVDRYVTGK
jgi:hypothetical protein